MNVGDGGGSSGGETPWISRHRIGYDEIGSLGSGAYGTVHLARDRVTGEEVSQVSLFGGISAWLSLCIRIVCVGSIEKDSSAALGGRHPSKRHQGDKLFTSPRTISTPEHCPVRVLH